MFFPDQHLGRNTAFRMGIPLDRMSVRHLRDRGGLSDDEMRESQVLLWKGHCSVHNRFTPEMVDARRAQIPGVKVIVHPECRFEVAQKADAIGSTEGILKTVRESPVGTKWAVGTELNMVNRLAREVAPEREVVSLDDCFCVCSTMFRIDPPHVLWALEYLVEGRLVNVVAVPEPVGQRGEDRPRPDAGHHLGRGDHRRARRSFRWGGSTRGLRRRARRPILEPDSAPVDWGGAGRAERAREGRPLTTGGLAGREETATT